MLKEFKNFIMKGNVLELAVAVIIAGAFGAIVTSFTKDVLYSFKRGLGITRSRN